MENPFSKKRLVELGGTGLSRRQIIGGGLGAAGIIVALGKRVYDQTFSSVSERESRKVPLEKSINLDTGFLAGRTVNDLFAYYLGFNERITLPGIIDISPTENIKKLWERKNNRRAGVTPVALEAARLAESKYYPGAMVEKTSFREYVNSVDAHITNLRASIDFEKLGEFLKFDNEELYALKVAAKEIGGREIVAYSMTELLPGDNGEYNAKFFDLILRNYGVEYLHWIPALYDEYTSFGPYQFTQFALFDAQGRKEGASRINQFVKDRKYQIPGSVLHLEGRAHDRAAYMFALFNIAMLIKEIETSEDVEGLVKVFHDKKDVLVGMIACMHNMPVTKSAFIEWVKLGAGGMPRPRNVSYLRKSVNNYRFVTKNTNVDYKDK